MPKKTLKYYIRALGDRVYRWSLQDNLRWLQTKLTHYDPLANTIRPDLMAQRIAAQGYLNRKVRSLSDQVVILGDGSEAKMLSKALQLAGKQCRILEDKLAFGDLKELPPLDPSVDLVISPWPLTPQDWQRAASLRAAVPNRVLTFQELLLPMELIQTGQQHLNYRFEDLSEVMSYYTGDQLLGPMDELNKLFPLKDKRVIEFGPMDGYQTAALINFGASSVACIEARPENALKTLAAKAAFGWSNVEVILDDFHNVSGSNYGMYDLAFAHGVYYHSFAPFVFFENLFSLSNHIFLGGYIATDADPPTEYVRLEYEGATYRAKEHPDGFGMTEGINLKGYYFAADDLERLFTSRGFKIIPISREEQHLPTGRYHRFLAVKVQD